MTQFGTTQPDRPHDNRQPAEASPDGTSRSGMPVRVKICGITNLEDALAAVEAGADAVGFIFHPPSPRYVRLDIAREITRKLPPFVARAGVFVDATEEKVMETVRMARLDTIQFHGKETTDFCQRFAEHRVIKAFRMDGPAALSRLSEYRDVTWLLDSYQPGVFGGTGQTFNWDLACEAVRLGGRVILAGGLTPENVARAVAAVRPYAVDVSSGVESAPGTKDAEKMRAFVAAAKSV
jgi:phosphoribosylanthranilate isomerase